MPFDLTFGTRRVVRDRALVMAIVNRTPDSFYDKGRTFDPAVALEAVRRAVGDGADIIDIGGVKAGPGDEVDLGEELDRTIPFVEAVRAEFDDVVISIDTWRADVGRQALAAGADLINDTWAGHDPELLDVVAETGCGFVCSHTGGVQPRTKPHRVEYDDVVASVIADTTATAESLVARGVPRAGLLIDPTHDFGKNTRHGLEILRRIDELVATRWPVLMAVSRKSFLGEMLGGIPADGRQAATLAATAVAARAGAAAFRTHDVVETRQALEVVAGIRGDREPLRTVRGLV